MKLISSLIALLIIQSTAATINVEKLQKLKETVQSQIQTLTETASTNLQEIANNIDLEKVKQLDILGVLPILQNGGQKLVEGKKAHVNKVKNHINKLKGIKGRIVTIDGLPRPAVYRKTYYIYSK